MHLHTSHRIDRLANAFAELVAREPLPWNQTEWVAVQGPGMERWLAMELADRLGGVLGVEHLFPRTLIERVLLATVGERARALRSWGDAALTWAVLAVLPRLLPREEFQPLRRYLGDEPEGAQTGSRRLALARELASLVDRYANYRPDVVQAWLAGRDDTGADAWQAPLVRALREAIAAPCHAELLEEAVRVLRSDAPIAGLPRRMTVFGVTTLPPMYLQLLDALSARQIEVHLFWLSPSAHYFGDQREAREKARARLQGEPVEDDDAGYPLLASLGRAARDFQVVLYGSCPHFESEHEYFEPAPDASTVLGRLQSDFHAFAATGSSDENPPVPFPTGDRSFVVHACHGRVRQVEALRDELLRAFVELPDLQPRDVAILCPDVDAYGPLVRAVFGDGDDASTEPAHRRGFPAIPVRVADTARRHDSSGIDALLAIVELASGRFTAPVALDVLMRPAVARRFRLDGIDPSVLHRLVHDTGMRWGIDADDRERFGQPRDDAFTLRRGLARLILGQAMRGDGSRAFGDVLPYDDADGRETVARLVDAFETIFAFAEALRAPRTPAELTRFFIGWMDRLVELEDDFGGERLVVEKALDAEARYADAVGCTTALDLPAQRALLEHALTADAGASASLGGAVSMASLVPMRAIPFRVIALLGLDEADFPRRSQGRGFDLVEQRRRPGDRRREDDDRAAMLEAILAARDRLVITYPGRDPHSNEALPMSAPVAELVDAVARSYVPADASPSTSPDAIRRSVLRHLLFEHALHSFGSAELAADDPRAFDARLLAQAQASTSRTSDEPSPWVDAQLALPAPDESGRVLVRVNELLRFFEDPVRSFVEDRARIELDPKLAELEDREPYELDALKSSSLAREVLRMTRDGVPIERQAERLRVAGRLPVGIAGDRVLQGIRAHVDGILEEARPVLASGSLPPLDVDATFDAIDAGQETVSVRLVGSVDDRFTDGIVRLHPGRQRAKHELRAFVERAVVSATCGEDAPLRLFGIGEGDAILATRFESMTDPTAYLRDALSVYLKGSRAPLPFTLDAAEKYLEAESKALAKGDLGAAAVAQTAVRKARATLDVDNGGRRVPERDRLDLRRLFGDPVSARVFDDDMPAGGALPFREVVDRVIRPLIEAPASVVVRSQEAES